jgi:nucleotide-binding universal stress UspA family protein
MTILVGYPTDRRAKAVLSLAAMLARSNGQDVVVCVVIVDPVVPGITSDSPEFRSCVDQLADKALKRARQDMPADVPVQFTTFDARSIPSGLVRAAEQYNATMIVVGSAMGLIERVAVSSIADRLLHSSPIPVAVATRGFRAGRGKVARLTLAFAGERTTTGVAAAEALAAEFGAELRLASFAVHLSAPEALRVHLESDAVLDQWTNRIRSTAQEAIGSDEAVTRRNPQIVIGHGDEWEEALDDIDWEAGDLLVIGSSQAGPLSRVFLGSTAVKIVRHTPVPVIAIPRTAATELAER